MEHLEHVRIAQKPTVVLSTVVFLGLSANLLFSGFGIGTGSRIFRSGRSGGATCGYLGKGSDHSAKTGRQTLNDKGFPKEAFLLLRMPITKNRYRSFR